MSAASAGGRVVHSAEGSPVVNESPSGQVADIGVVVSLGGLAAARVAAERDRLVAGVLSDVVIGQVHLRLGGLDGEHLAGQAALQRQRVACVGELAQAFPPGPQGGQGREPGQRPASAAVRCLACSRVSAPRVNDNWVHTRMPRSSTGAPGPAADAPVPAVSRARAPIRSVKACTSIAPA